MRVIVADSIQPSTKDDSSKFSFPHKPDKGTCLQSARAQPIQVVAETEVESPSIINGFLDVTLIVGDAACSSLQSFKPRILIKASNAFEAGAGAEHSIETQLLDMVYS